MNFLLWLNEIFTQQVAMHFDLYYSKTLDWVLQIYIKQENKEDNIQVFYGQDTDVSLLMAKAEAAVKEWLRENRNGY